MVQPTYPGVYVVEVPSGVRPIAQVGSSITAFVDFFRKGPMNRPVSVFGPADFERIFGGLHRNSEASYAIEQFFLNGGSHAIVVRTASGAPARAQATIASLAVGGVNIFTATAKNEGTWAHGAIRLRVEHQYDAAFAETGFDLHVTQYETAADVRRRLGPPKPGQDERPKVLGTEKFLNLSVAPANPRYFVRVVNSESQLMDVAHLLPGAGVNLPAVTGTLSQPIALPIAGGLNGVLAVTINAVVGNANLAIPGPVTRLSDVRGPIEQAIRASQADNPHFTGATVTIAGNRLLIQAGRLANNYAPAQIVTVGGALAAALGFNANAARENVQEYNLGLVVAGAQTAIVAGADGGLPTATELRGNPVTKTGIHALRDADLFNILCIPRAAELDDNNLNAVYTEAINFCEQRRAFLIIDIPGGENGARRVRTLEEIRTWIDQFATLRHRNAAVYYPRVLQADGLDEFRSKSRGASGTMAGVYSRTDTERGVFKAPAGIEATLRGVIGYDFSPNPADPNPPVLTDAENGVLNPIAVNCLRSFPIYGRVSWGARTLVGADDAGSEWRYIPIRRLALLIEESLFRGIRWAVFEGNDEPLWAKLRKNVGAFMLRLFRQGAFQGSTPKEAFYVKCDAETNPPSNRNLGIVTVEVGFAPLKPAEFVVLKIQQMPDIE